MELRGNVWGFLLFCDHTTALSAMMNLFCFTVNIIKIIDFHFCRIRCSVIIVLGKFIVIMKVKVLFNDRLNDQYL